MTSDDERVAVPLDLSVVIPSFNSAEWLPTTFTALGSALLASDLNAEVIVIDDGSQDATSQAVSDIAREFPAQVRYIRQDNQGRFHARWTGLRASSAAWVLLLDSRVLLETGALRHAFDDIHHHPDRVALNAHITIDATAPLIGRFWDVPTWVFWRRYLRDPRPFDLTRETFDQAPKGTTVFLARRDVLEDAFAYSAPDGDAHLVSDDTKVLRRIAETRSIRIDPGFAAVYRPRTTLRGFVRHTFDRGTLFVDSYAGTSVLRSIVLVAAAIAPPVFVALVVWLFSTGLWNWAVALLVTALGLALLPAIVAAFNRCPGRGVIAYISVLPIFAVPFWLGLVRGTFMHRGSFTGRSRQSASKNEGDR